MFGSFLGALIALTCALAVGWKWELGFRRIALPLVAVFLVAGLGAGLVGGSLLGVSWSASASIAFLAFAVIGLTLLARRFYGDPDREPPSEDGAIVSPADGTVVYVKGFATGATPASQKRSRAYVIDELADSSVVADGAIVIGIAMNYLDVHVNRAPVSGCVQLVRRRPGSFASLKRLSAVLENERVTTVIAAGAFELAVVQIASRLVRRIVSFVCEGDEVELGQRLGMIRFGSQVDLILPARPDLVPSVTAGDRVLAGETIIATYTPTTASNPPKTASPGVA